MTIIEFECKNCEKKGTLASIASDIPPGYVKLFACSKCKETLYCSKQCQTDDWNKSFFGHKSMCSKWAAERRELLAAGERSIHDRTVQAAKSGFSHTLTKTGGRKPYQLIEGENWLNTIVGVAYEEEDYFKGDENHVGVCLLVDGPFCAVMRKSKSAKVKIIRAGAPEGEGDVLPRLQMKMLASGDRISVQMPSTSNPLLSLSGFNDDYTVVYSRETTKESSPASAAS